MRRDDDAELIGKLEGRIHLAVVDAEEILVGEEDLEGRDAVPTISRELAFGLSSNFVTDMWKV